MLVLKLLVAILYSFFFLPDAIFNTDLREKLERAKSVSVLCDGSTDSPVVEKECFYWLHVARKTFYPKLSFLSLKNLSFDDTEGIKQAIEGALDKKNLSNLRKKNCIFLCSDDASMNSSLK